MDLSLFLIKHYPKAQSQSIYQEIWYMLDNHDFVYANPFRVA